jgi:alanine-glyoxylate transaminase/serine-glyoxylate transaminase/serine-pyruvate transaminase
MSGNPGLFIPGPTNMPTAVQRAMTVALEDQRSPDFPKLTLPLFRDLKKVFKTESGQVFMFPGSGTGGWEAAITNTLSPGDKVVIAVFGQFSHLWADLCQRHGLEVDIIDTEWGVGARPEEYAKRLEADKDKRIKAVLVCHNETATGVSSDIGAIRKVMDELDHPAMLMVDGVSSIASIDFRMDEWGVDIAVSGSQKGFMLPTGLAIVAVSQKALAAYDDAKLPRCFFDFGDMIKLNADGYFPYTPATTLFHGLRASLDILFEEGLENVYARHHRLAEAVRQGVHAWGLELCAKEPKWYSDTVSAIVVPPHIDARDIISAAFKTYQLSLGTGLTKVMGKVFRIGHLGSLNELMVLQALAGTEMALRDAGYNVELGSGVAAAQRYLIEKAATPSLRQVTSVAAA